MRQYTTTYHRIQSRRRVGDSWTTWCALTPTQLFRPVELMVYHCKLIEGIEEAQRIWLGKVGQLHDIEFRCVTDTTTVTATAALHDGWTE